MSNNPPLDTNTGASDTVYTDAVDPGVPLRRATQSMPSPSSMPSSKTNSFSHYFKDVPYPKIDVYRLLLLFGVTDPCLQHAIKKLLVPGVRGAKTVVQDVGEAVATLVRYLEMRREDVNTEEQHIGRHTIEPHTARCAFCGRDQTLCSVTACIPLREHDPTSEHFVGKVAVKVVLYRPSDGRVLITLDRRWELPGGRVNRGENVAEAARRELQEELDLRMDDDALLSMEFVYSEYFIQESDGSRGLMIAVALPLPLEQIPDPPPGEVKDWRWASEAELLGLDFYPNCLAALRAYFRRQTTMPSTSTLDAPVMHFEQAWMQAADAERLPLSSASTNLAHKRYALFGWELRSSQHLGPPPSFDEAWKAGNLQIMAGAGTSAQRTMARLGWDLRSEYGAAPHSPQILRAMAELLQWMRSAVPASKAPLVSFLSDQFGLQSIKAAGEGVAGATGEATVQPITTAVGTLFSPAMTNAVKLLLGFYHSFGAVPADEQNDVSRAGDMLTHALQCYPYPDEAKNEAASPSLSPSPVVPAPPQSFDISGGDVALVLSYMYRVKIPSSGDSSNSNSDDAAAWSAHARLCKALNFDPITQKVVPQL